MTVLGRGFDVQSEKVKRATFVQAKQDEKGKEKFI